MAALDFPSSPSDGQVFIAGNGVTYQWNAAKSLWLLSATKGLIAAPTFDVSTTGQSSGATTYSGGDTAMTISMGAQIFSRTYTAVDPTHPIEVDIMVNLQAPNSTTVAASVVGLFIDGATNAVAQTVINVPAGTGLVSRVYWQGVLAAGAHTFAVRFAGFSGTGIYTCMADSGHMGGGAVRNTMAICEIGIGPQGPQGPSGPAGVLTAPSIYDKLTTAQPADAGGYTWTVPMTITQGSQVPWPGGAIKSFTAADPTRPIEVDVSLVHGAGAATNTVISALFIDGATNAVQESAVGLFAQSIAVSRILWRGVLSAGAHTFQVRWCGSTGSYLLRNDSTVFTGSGIACTIAIREVG